MADPVIDIGTGTAIVFGTSAWSAELLSLSWSGMSRPAIDATHMGTVKAGADTFGSAAFIATDIADGGELTIEVHFNPDTTPPIGAVAETITITWPTPTGNTAPGTWAFSGFMKSFDVNDPMEDKMTATAVIRVSAGVTIVAGTA